MHLNVTLYMVQPIRSCVTFKFTNLGEKDKIIMFFRMVGEYGPRSMDVF